MASPRRRLSLESMVEEKVEVSVDGERLRMSTLYQQNGPADLFMVLLPGLGLTKEIFMPIRFTDFGVRILAFDLVGHGNTRYFDRETSSWTREVPEKCMDLEYQAKAIYSALEHVRENWRSETWQDDPMKLVIVGHSMGGSVAVYLSHLIEQSTGLDHVLDIYIEPNLIRGDCEFTEKIHQEISLRKKGELPGMSEKDFFSFLRSLYSSDVWDRYVKAVQQNISHQNYIEASENLRERSILAKDPKNPYAGQLLSSLCSLRRMSESRFYYIYGSLSNIPMRHNFKKLPYLNPVMIPDAGHFSMDQRPDKFYEALREIVISRSRSH
jgi:pimeloyl-ACP methyl ester carboxylesterase